MQGEKKARIDWKFMTPLVLSNMMNPLNSSMLVTALGTICHHFSQEVSAGALLVTPLYVAATIGQPLMGRLADMYDPKTINKIGVLLVLLAGVIGMLAPSFSWLIVSRVLLGIGTSAAYPSSMAIVAHRYAEEGKTIPGSVLGVITVSSQVCLVVGPLLGGFLTQLLGWQGVFAINIPWALATLFFSKNISPIKRSVVTASFLKKIDMPGILLFSALLIFLLLTFIQHHIRWEFLLAILLSFAGLVVRERTQENPFIDIRLLWTQPSLLLVYVRTLATNYILYLLIYAMPQWVEAVKSMSPAQTGFIVMPMTLMSALSAILTSKTKNMTLINICAIASMALTCAAIFLLDHTLPLWEIIAVTLLAGTAMGINIVANQVALSAEAPSGKTGVSFGLYRTFGYLGAIVSGMQIKTLFQKGVNDRSIYLCGVYASISCFALAVFYFSSFRKLVLQREKV